jgi:hypothetical protein
MPEPRTLDYGPHGLRLSSGVLWAKRQRVRSTETRMGRNQTEGAQQKGK